MRASQLNGCAYCVDMHTKDARAAGENEQRLYAVPVLAARRRSSRPASGPRSTLTESVTQAATTHVPDEDFGRAAAVFSETELAAIVSLIVTINAWNAIGVTTRAWLPGSYQP